MRIGKMTVQSKLTLCGDIEIDLCPNLTHLDNFFVENINRVRRNDESLTALTKKADPLLRRWLLP